jgi:hypothetical protein
MKQNQSLLGITAGALLVLLLVFYWPFLSNSSCFYLSDISLLHEPLNAFLGASMARGNVPLWNPYILAGMPTVAFMSPSPLYPFQFLFAVLPFNSAYAVLMLINHMAAATGGYLLICALGWGRRSAVLFGVCFSLSSFLFSLQAVPTLMAVAGWWPWAAYSLVQMHVQSSGRRRLLFCVVLAIASYLMLTAGSLDVAALCLCLLFGWSVRRALLSPAPGWQKVVVLALSMVGMAVAVLMSMAQVVPLLEWASISPRSSGMGTRQVLDLSANWYDLLGLLVPHPLGDRSLIDNPFLSITESYFNPNTYLPSVYLGPVLITLSIWGMLDRRWSLGWWIFVGVALSAFAALGEHTAVIPYLVQTFNFKVFRFPVKLLMFSVVFLLLAAARGLMMAPDLVSATTMKFTGACWLVVMVAGASLMVSFPPQSAASAIGLDLLLSGVGGVVVCFLVSLVKSGRRTGNFFRTACIAGAVGLLLFQAATVLRHTGPRNFFGNRSVLLDAIAAAASRTSHWQSSALQRVVSLTWAGHLPARYLSAQTPTVSYYQSARQIFTPLSNIDFRLGALGANQYINITDNSRCFDQAYALHQSGNDAALARYCRITASNYAIDYWLELNGASHRQLDPRYFESLKQEPELNCVIYRLKRPMPRAYFPTQFKWGHPHEAVIEFLSHSDNFDPASLTILEHGAESEQGPLARGAVIPGTITWLKDAAEEIVLRAETKQDNVLVLADTFYPGWRVALDGRPVPLIRANGFTRAVFVPSGLHMVAFTYRPTSILLGICLSGFGVILLLLMLSVALVNGGSKNTTSGELL